MNASDKTVSVVDALVTAARNKSAQRIVIQDDLAGLLSFRLSSGQFLHDASEQSSVTFTADSDGLQFSSGNAVYRLRLHVSSEKRAIFNDSAAASPSRVALCGVRTTGRVRVIARDRVRASVAGFSAGRISVPVFGCGCDKI